jgi:hypothetical protein
MTVADVGAATRRNEIPLGVAYMVGSTVKFAGGNAVVKWQLATYPIGEVAFGRTLFALAFGLAATPGHRIGAGGRSIGGTGIGIGGASIGASPLSSSSFG